MTKIHEAWLPLVLDEGQLGRVEGVFIGSTNAVLTDAGWTFSHYRGDLMTMPVFLRTDVDLTELDGKDVSVVGKVNGDRLTVADPSTVTPRKGQRRQTPVRRERPAAGESAARQIPRRPAAETALLESGAVLAAWKDGSRTKAIIADPAVEGSLADLYGDALDVTQSWWPASTLTEIEALLAEQKSTVVMFLGSDIGRGDGQLRVSAVLHHLPTDLAIALSALTPDALVLDVLVQPA